MVKHLVEQQMQLDGEITVHQLHTHPLQMELIFISHYFVLQVFTGLHTAEACTVSIYDMQTSKSN